MKAVSILVLIATVLWLLPSAGQVEPGLMAGEALITAKVLFEQVKILASDEMEGRATGTLGLDRAAAYIAKEFEKAGNIETVIIRPPWFYGPYQPPRQTLFFRMQDRSMQILF